MIKAKVSADYKDIGCIFAGGAIQKEIIKVWSTEADAYVFETWRVLEMEDPLPLTLNANGEPLIDYQIYGNTEQSGAPTPDNPIMPIGCGERTENLIDDYLEQAFIDISAQGVVSSYSLIDLALFPIEQGSTYTIKRYTSQMELYVGFFVSKPVMGSVTYDQTVHAPSPFNAAIFTFVAPITGWAAVRSSRSISPKSTVYVVKGSIPPDTYIPYGYKLPILSNSTVLYWSLTNIYLGEVETTRRIKKLVLDGTESFIVFSQVGGRYRYSLLIPLMNKSETPPNYCTHFRSDYNIFELNNNTINNAVAAYQNRLYFYTTEYATNIEFKAFLANQYAAGTPVTVWYVLAEPEIGIVNEPLMKIGDYADTVDSARTNVQIPTFAGTTVIDYDGGEKHFITSDGYALVDKNQNDFLLSDSTLCPDKMYIKYKGR